MPAVAATDFFLALCERAENSTAVDVDALAIGEMLGIHSPTVFAHVHELKVRGWIESAAPRALGGLFVRLTIAGASRSASERARWKLAEKQRQA
jgi:hypothetical protein